jgi:FMN reductase
MEAHRRPRALLLAGSRASESRSAALLAAAGRVLAGQDFAVQTLTLDGPRHAASRKDTLGCVPQADVVVLGMPVADAASVGRLKAFVDRLPAGGLAGKWTWTLAVGGQPAQRFALDIALQSVLDAHGSPRRVPTLHATEAQIVRTDGAVHATLAIEIACGLQAAAARLAVELGAEQRRRAAPAPPHERLRAAPPSGAWSAGALDRRAARGPDACSYPPERNALHG